jgi:hypothetical protein
VLLLSSLSLPAVVWFLDGCSSVNGNSQGHDVVAAAAAAAEDDDDDPIGVVVGIVEFRRHVSSRRKRRSLSICKIETDEEDGR